MNDRRFHVNGRAFSAYHNLSPAERKAIDRSIARLVDLPEEQWPKAGAVRLKSAEPLYMLRVDASLRAIVRPGEDGEPELLDLVRHETLELYFKAAHSSGHRA
jgi:hypothetical protein